MLAALLAILALLLLLVGRRGKRINDHPICAACRFDLIGLTAPAICPECGSDLAKARAVRDGLRQRRPVPMALGLLFTLVSVGLTGTFFWGRLSHYDWNKIKPSWWLIREAVAAAKPAEPVLTELMARGRAGFLDSADFKRLAARAMERQLDPSLAWSTTWGDLVDVARSRSAISTDQYAQYLASGVTASLEVRPIVHCDKALSCRLSLDLARGSSASSFEVHTEDGELLVELDNGEQLRLRVQTGLSGWDGWATTSSSVCLPKPVPPGKWKTTLSIPSTVLYMRPDPVPPATKEFTQTRVIEFVTQDQPIVKMIPNESLHDVILHSITQLDLDSSGALRKDYLVMRSRFYGLPVNVSFRAKAVGRGDDGTEHEWELPPIVIRKEASQYRNGCQLPKEFTASTVTVILTSDPGPAEQTIDIDEAWAGEIVIPNVKVRRHW